MASWRKGRFWTLEIYTEAQEGSGDRLERWRRIGGRNSKELKRGEVG